MDVPGGTFGLDNFGGLGGGDEIDEGLEEEEDEELLVEDADVFNNGDCGSSFFGGGFFPDFPSSLILLIGIVDDS